MFVTNNSEAQLMSQFQLPKPKGYTNTLGDFFQIIDCVCTFTYYNFM